MALTRRALIQQAGLLSAGVCLGDFAGVQRYQQALAQSTPRKLALLVGINQYAQSQKAPSLKGSLTDVELQRELLIHRFGFARQDVLTLLDEQATRSNIEAAFITHLAEQAKAGDLIVFHFSGYGCALTPNFGLDSRSQPDIQQALVSYDGWLPNPGLGGQSLFNGISEDTLFLLLRSLRTDQVVTVLDCGLQPCAQLRCNSIRERALPSAETRLTTSALQARLLQQTQLTLDQVQVQRQSGQLPGLVFAAAAQTPALELDRSQFSAGLLTYGLTQQLWASTPPTKISVQLGRLCTQLSQQVGPGPQLTSKGQRSGTQPWSAGLAAPQAVGVVALVDQRGQMAQLWLGGLPAALVAQSQVQSCFRVFSESPRTSSTLVQVRSRRGWTAMAQRQSGPPLQKGQFLEEALRVLPRTVTLTLALGSDLDRIERVDATSVISMEKRSLQVVGSQQPADYVLTKVVSPKKIGDSTPAVPNMAIQPLPAVSYGLADLGGGFLPNTIGERGEVVKLAVQRLRPVLDTLLAIKLLELSLNDTAVAPCISATLEQVAETPQPLIRVQSASAVLSPLIDATAELAVPKADKIAKVLSIASTTALQYRISNWDTVPVYVLLVGFNGGTVAFASYAVDSATATSGRKPMLKPVVVQPGSSVILPAAGTWKASSFAGLNRTFIVCTRQPLLQTLAAQANGMKSTLLSVTEGLTPLLSPLVIAQKILADLHQASLSETTSLGIRPAPDQWALDLQAWATLQLTYLTA